MPAEMVRDHALAASGLLVRRVGEASTFPYQPKNMWDGFNVYKYPEPEQVPADSHHRRSLYSLIKRNALHPGMASFDMPERWYACAAQHLRTPLQALVLLDDPQFVEAYARIAAHVLKTETAKDAQRATVSGWPRGVGPEPRSSRRCAYRSSQLAEFSADRDAAEKLLAVGVTRADASVDKMQLAALTNVATVVMNTPDAYSLR